MFLLELLLYSELTGEPVAELDHRVRGELVYTIED